MNGPGCIVAINLSRGGVPKRPVAQVEVTREGLVGDWQADRRYHGGPERAVSLFSLELIEALQREGHPIAPGTTGENLTLAGLDWAALRPGARLLFENGVELQVCDFAAPCKTIRGSFLDGGFERIAEKRQPGQSRLYTRVLHEGVLQSGEGVRSLPA